MTFKTKDRDRDTVKSRDRRHDYYQREVDETGESNTLEQMHRQFQAEVEQSDELDDPLDVYVRYVNWITEAYTSTSVHHHNNISRESGLFALLEKSIRTFKNEKQYKNDARYVRLNIMYIHMIKDPLPMFKFMMTNGIGSELATFYEEYAAFLESTGDGRKALEIMRLGAEREARPLQRLKRKLGELEQRINPSMENSESSRPSSVPTRHVSDIQQHNHRSILASRDEPAIINPSTHDSYDTRTKGKLAVYADKSSETSSKSLESSHTGKQGHKDRFPVTIGTTGRKERLMVDLVAVYTDGELQLDELRARLPRYNKPAPVPPPEVPVRPPSRSLFSSSSSHVLSTKMSSSRENTLDFSIRIKGDASISTSSTILQDVRGDQHDRPKTPPPVRYPTESDLIPRTPPEQVRPAFGTTLVPRIELTPGESRKRSLSRNYITSSPTMHSKSAYVEMNKIFSDRSRISQGSVYWSDDYQEDYTITRTQFSEFGASSESEQDLEGGSTMTREIQAMKRQRANEAGDHTDIFDRRSSQMSVGSRTSTSDITRAIEARGGFNLLSQESRSRSSLGKSMIGTEHPLRSSLPNNGDSSQFRSSFSSSSIVRPSLSWTNQPDSFTSAATTTLGSSQKPTVTKKFRPRMFEVFRDEQDHDTPDLAMSNEIPALGDEEPPSQLDVHGEDDLRDISWQAEDSNPGDYLGSQQYSLKKTLADSMSSSISSSVPPKAPNAAMSSSTAYRPLLGSTTSASRPAPSASFGSILRSVSAPFSRHSSTKESAAAATTSTTVLQQPSPPRIQELQSLFSPGKPPALPSLVSAPPKVEDKPARPSMTSRLSGGKTVQMQRPLFPNPCFPGSQRIRSTILGRLVPGLKAYAGYYEDLEFIMENHLRLERSAKRAEKSSFSRNTSSGSNRSLSSNASGGSSRGSSSGRSYLLGWSSSNTESEAMVQLGQESFLVLRKIGEGGYAKVYGVEGKNDLGQTEARSRQTGAKAGSNNTSSGGSGRSRMRMQVLKLERPGNSWEFYILSQIHQRFQASGLLRIRASVIQPISFYRFKDESYLIMDYCPYGTLLDAINVCRKKTTGGAMDESLALFFTIELLRVLEGLHVKGIVHGDLKADNCMLRFDSYDQAEFASNNVNSNGSAAATAAASTPVTSMIQTSYEPNGGGGWSKCGIKLIDFGRAVDLTQFDRDMEFLADWPVDAQDCPEIRAEKPWRFHPDYFGLAKIVFTMLTGLENMPTTTTSEVLPGGELFGAGADATVTSSVFDERRYRVSEKESPGTFVYVVPNDHQNKQRQRLDYTMRRYWKQELWRPLFDILLNPALYRPADRPWEPCTAALAQVRAWMQQHLSRQRADEPRGIRKLLAQLETLLVESQKTKPSAR
ncbi:hypothetical protein BGW42_003472 [Actinomortierella wolfii]|nr:hypothetical protein BGW42_003472 [Actinomortierella wolfii]